VEHHAVGHALLHLEKFGFEIVTLPVDRYGRVDPDEVDAAINDRTILVAVQLANNEVGTVQPVAEIAARVHARKGVLLVVDAVAAAPYLAIDVEALGADLLAIAAHKLEGPKGVGALYLRHGIHLLAQQHGGTQERYRRAGTEDVAGAVGMAVALDLACEERPATASRLRSLRGRLAKAVVGAGGAEMTGHPAARLPGLLSVVAHGLDGAALVMALDLAGVAASVGSACTTGSLEPSHVLTAMGYPAEEARGALRLSMGRTTTAEDVDAAASIITRVLVDQRTAAGEVAADPLGLGVV
jgi:cysteine desulfurase